MGPRRIAFINEKGGSGKTTLAANVACHLADHHGLRVLAVDMDPQGQLGKVLGVDVRRARHSAIELLVDSVLHGPDAPSRASRPESKLPIVHTRLPNLDVIVANKALALFPAWSEADRPLAGGADEGTVFRLRHALSAAPQLEHYDLVLMDAPPSFGALTLNVLCACDELVVPVPLTYLALDGCAALLETIELVRARYAHTKLRISLVVPTFHRRTRLAAEILEALQTRFPAELAKTVVGYHVRIDEAQSRGLSVFEYAPRDKGARVMEAIADEILARAPMPKMRDRRGGAAEGDEDGMEAASGAAEITNARRRAGVPQADGSSKGDEA
jgi:chromosome partitioning protein